MREKQENRSWVQNPAPPPTVCRILSSHLPSLGFSFLTCEMVPIIVPISWRRCEVQMRLRTETFSATPGT